MHPHMLSASFVRLIIISMMSLAVCASAQIQPPSGWTAHPNQNALVLLSPTGWNSSSVALTLLPPRPIPGQVDLWFTIESNARSRSGGVPVAATDVMHQGPLLIRVVQIQTQGGIAHAAFYSYAASGWQQMVVLIIPPGVADTDPRLRVALNYVYQLAVARVDLGRSLGYAPPSGASSASASDQLQRSFDQAESLQRFNNNMTNLTINQMNAINGTRR